MKTTFETTDGAVLLVDKEVSDRMGSAVHHLNDGIAQKRAGRYQEAIRAYERGIADAPENINGYKNAAKMLAGLGRDHEALRYWTAYAHAIFAYFSWDDAHIRSIADHVLGQLIQTSDMFDETIHWTEQNERLLSQGSSHVRVLLTQVNVLDHTGRSYAMIQNWLKDWTLETNNIVSWRMSLLGKPMPPSPSRMSPGAYHKIGLLFLLSSVQRVNGGFTGSPSQYYTAAGDASIATVDALNRKWHQ